MKLIRGDDNDYKQWKEVVRQIIDLEKEIESYKKRLQLAIDCDGYKDDVISTQRQLLEAKETYIAELMERVIK